MKCRSIGYILVLAASILIEFINRGQSDYCGLISSPGEKLTKTRLIILLAPLFVLLGCTHSVPGLETQKFIKADKQYTYQLYLPESAMTPAPLVVALHRFTENGTLMARLSGFNDVAARHGFAVIYPDGPSRRFEPFDNDRRDDAGMILAMIEDIAQKVSIDQRRIYVTGASNGGFMVHRLACQYPDIFAAAAPVMALMPRYLQNDCSNEPSIPMLMIHGTDDSIVKEDARSIWAGDKYAVLPMDKTVSYWARRNHPNREPYRVLLPDRDPDDSTRIERIVYAAGLAETIYYRVKGGGHTWPGGTERAPTFIVGRTSRDMDASDVIWEFFARHHR
jgi:polyhydroxybutyrate depolymerase